MTPVTYKTYFKNLSEHHKNIKGFFRGNLSEIQGSFREGIQQPAMMLESYENDFDSNHTSVIKESSFAFTIYVSPELETSILNTFDQEDLSLSIAEQIGDEVILRMRKDSLTKGSGIYGMFDPESVKSHKVGPIFTENLFGYRFTGFLKGNIPNKVDTNTWSDLPDPTV